MKICLVIIFNHRYDDIIPKLREIYGNRFENILFLVPFYDGVDTDVISVYESSYQFPGFLIQSYSQLHRNEADYCVFIGDDLLLNPMIDEKNIIDVLNLKEKAVFVEDIGRMNRNGMFAWSHSRYSSKAFRSAGVEWKKELPSKEEAISLFNAFFDKGYEEQYTDEFFEGRFSDEDEVKHLEAKVKFLKENGGTREIPYPMAFGYSDIFVISKDYLWPIARTTGIFSAMNLFAEIALPTSIVLTVPKEQVNLLKRANYTKSIVAWGEEREQLSQKYVNLSQLFINWPKDVLYIHPIKLSQWKDE